MGGNAFLDVASDVQRVASDPVRYVRENFSLARRSLEQLLDGARQPRGVVVETLLLVLRAMAGVNEFLMGEFESSAETGSSSVLKDFSDTSSGTEADSSTPRALDFHRGVEDRQDGLLCWVAGFILARCLLSGWEPISCWGTFDSVGPHVRSKLQVSRFSGPDLVHPAGSADAACAHLVGRSSELWRLLLGRHYVLRGVASSPR